VERGRRYRRSLGRSQACPAALMHDSNSSAAAGVFAGVDAWPPGVHARGVWEGAPNKAWGHGASAKGPATPIDI
jgi:hypothetical protein